MPDFIEANRSRRYGLPGEEEILEEHNERVACEEHARQALAEKFCAAYGMKIGPIVPAPVDKVSGKTSSDAPAPSIGVETAEHGFEEGQVGGGAPGRDGV
jgi:hypothetical protein